MWKRRGAYRVLVKKPEGRRTLGRPRHKWENNIKMYLREVGWGSMHWINLVEDRDSWWVVVKSVMIFWVPQNAGNFLSG
jgi:hypothetical protein